MEDLPPGFRFYPTEEELVSFYLHVKLEGRRPELKPIMDCIIPELNIYSYNPSDLPQLAGEVCRRNMEEWFFFIPMQEREARGGRPNRLTDVGYWKATGCPGHVYSSDNRVIGDKRTMVFYEGRAPSGRKTEWKMNEYKAVVGGDQLRHEVSLCRVYKKSKTIRAFDRRPSGRDAIGIGIGAPPWASSRQEHHLDQAIKTTRHLEDIAFTGDPPENPPCGVQQYLHCTPNNNSGEESSSTSCEMIGNDGALWGLEDWYLWELFSSC